MKKVTVSWDEEVINSYQSTVSIPDEIAEEGEAAILNYLKNEGSADLLGNEEFIDSDIIESYIGIKVIK